MTKSADIAEFNTIIDKVFDNRPPDISATDDVYDRYMTSFLRLLKTAKHPDKARWILMRAGLRYYINDLRSAQRARLKAEDPYEIERIERNRARNADQRASKKWREDWCAKRGVPVEQFHDQFMRECREDGERKMNDYVNQRAARILSAWLCDGAPLSDVTGLELDRVIAKEDATALGHQANATFYRGLREFTPDEKTVGASVAAEDLIRVFNSSFKERFSWDMEAA